MYLQWEYDSEAQSMIDQRAWEPKPLSPVLAGEGDDFERRQLTLLQGGNRRVVGIDLEEELELEYDTRLPSSGTEARLELVEKIEDVAASNRFDPSITIHQAPLEGQIGVYRIRGYADIVDLSPTDDGFQVTVCEVKSSTSQKVHHRYQATIYSILLEALVEVADVDSKDVRIRTAIVTPENDVSEGIDELQTFPIGAYRTKLELQLQEGGAFDQVILGTSVEGTKNRIAQRCSGCEYEPLCVTRGVENQGLELLGLQAGTQESLGRLGINTLEDIALLFEQPGDNASHTEYDELVPRNEELVQQVRQEAEVSNLQTRTQIAYRFLNELDDAHGRDGPDFFPHELQGTGYNLPRDDHPAGEINWQSDNDFDYPSEGIVQVYVYVQQDFAQDRITLLSAYVTNSRTERSEQITQISDVLPKTDSDKDRVENNLFFEFFQSLASAVEAVAPDWNNNDVQLADGLELNEGDGFLHLYLYSDQQRKALMEAIRRHPTARWRRPLRTLLGLRAGIDQEMVSILQNDFRRRWALRFPGLGLLQSTAQFKPYCEDWFNWQAERSDGSTADLHKIFRNGLFGSVVSHDNPDGNLRLNHSDTDLAWTPDDGRLARWVYPVKHRDVDTIPPAYVWGVFDRLEPESTDDPERARRYQYRSNEFDDRISEEDLRLLATRFSRAVEHVEGGISNKSWHVNKHPIDLSSLSDFSFDSRTIDDACVEYQQLEYHTVRTELESYYSRPLPERIDSGSSIAFKCTHIDDDRNVIRGRLLNSRLEPFDPSSSDGIIGGPLSVSNRDFMVLTKLKFGDGRPEAVYNDDPTNIIHSPTAIVSSIDESNGIVEITLPFGDGWPRGYQEYTTWHKGWGTDEKAREDDFTVHVSEGDRFVIDPMVDQITQARAYEALQNASNTPVRRWLREFYQGEREQLTVEGWNKSYVEEYLDSMTGSEEFARPNEHQENLITDVNSGIVTLQGPPGTGKTDYTVAPAILSRLHASVTTDSGFLGFVSAVSHSAVDEVLESVLELYLECPLGDGDQSIPLLRICSSSAQGFDDDRVDNVYYNDTTDERFQELYEQYFESDNDATALVFGPPVSVRSFFNAMCRAVDDMEHDRISEMMDKGDSSLFDLVVIDEASMIDLPLCLLAGSFLAANGQLLLVGDHRQMQPIQKHDWEDEDRKPIQVHAPFLSALDFLRYLRGENVDIEYFEAEPPGLSDPNSALPVYRLRETYRLPPESASLHTDLFYEQDNIELKSTGGCEHLPPVDGPLADILDSSNRVTLIVHDEATSQKSNPVEQALITELLNAFSSAQSEKDDLTAGVVVPFRAQRRDVIDVTSETVQVDTVERFQGGERDLMILSMTSSDRGYISQISEFLLDPNRFNVGASRMKRKLVILASAGIFEESSNDVDLFEDHKAWVKMFRRMGGIDGFDDRRQVRSVVSDETWELFLEDIPEVSDTEIRVYSGYER